MLSALSPTWQRMHNYYNKHYSWREDKARHAGTNNSSRDYYGSTCGTLVFTNSIWRVLRRLLQRPLWMSFSALSQRSIMTLLSHQLLCMPISRTPSNHSVRVLESRVVCQKNLCFQATRHKLEAIGEAKEMGPNIRLIDLAV